MSTIDRRRFSAVLAALSLTSAGTLFAAILAKSKNRSPEPEILQLSRNGWMPNNPYLPVLIYRGVAGAATKDLASQMEAQFQRNGWPPQWRNGVYTFHHYHSTAHEVLGFAAGHADLVLGGEGGTPVTVHAGDIAVLPTGTGHCRITASDDFLVIGAYPPDEHWDICRTAATPEVFARMRSVSFPASDPVTGPSGALPKLWTT
jgi:uncharacterized protein YjlB